ncbi:MAG: ABC transporter permease [Gemmatimonadota bacterium]
MNWIFVRLRRVRLWLSRSSHEQQMSAEMQYHIECETAELVARGTAPAAARREALLRFGGVERFKEESRDSRGVRRLEDLTADLRHATRVLLRAPTFTLAVVLTLALGIGATAALYTVVHGVVLRDLPYVEPHRLVAIWERNAQRQLEHTPASMASFEAWRAEQALFDGMAALVPAPSTLTGAGAASRVAGAQVSPGYFTLLGSRAMLGRTLLPSDEVAGTRLVVLSHAFWSNQLAADRAVVGKTIALDNVPYTVIGVMPPSFEPPRLGWMADQDLWIPLIPAADLRAWGRAFAVIGRMHAGVTKEVAVTALDRLAAQHAESVPEAAGWSTAIVDLRREITGDARTPLLVLLGAVGLLLVMGIVNVATLTLAHLRRREGELALRVSLGASRGRVVRQLLAQSSLLALVGGVAGTLAAAWGVRILYRLLPAEIAKPAIPGVDAPVVIASAVISIATALVCGILPAWRATRGNAASTLREHASVRITRRSGRALVVAEVALALVLSVAAGLAVRSFVALQAVDLGFDPHTVTTMRIMLPTERYPDAGRRLAVFDAIVGTARAQPGVTAAGAVSLRPFGGGGPRTTVLAEGAAIVAGMEPPPVDIRWADRDYFRALQMPLLAGRLMSATDRADAPPVVVITRGLADHLWPGGSPIGKRAVIQLNGGITAEVIGVVADARIAGVRQPPNPTAYLAIGQSTGNSIDLMVRGNESIVPVIRQALASIDPDVPLFRVASLNAVIGDAVASERFTAFILAAFGLCAMMLAAVGIHGMCAGDVQERQRELGIRLALGAEPVGITALVLRYGLGNALLGLGIGTVVALLVTRAMRAILFGITPTDPVAFVGIAGVLLVVAFLATLLPALRAARVSPQLAMREER